MHEPAGESSRRSPPLLPDEMTGTAGAAARPGAYKRDTIVSAALRLVARSGLHNTPMSEIAREAGVAAGTLYLYFESKEALINAVYLELVSNQARAASTEAGPGLRPREQAWHSWSNYARWHLDNPEASNFIQQCEASAILMESTRARQLEIRSAGLERFAAGVRQGLLREIPVEVFYALFMGPILVLAGMREKQEIEITDEILELTFDGVCRSVLPPGT
jgi:TetR/AcrR family transcriptional regulator, repressor of fatR-cypB operon